ncbi:MAG: aspartate/glutamate racemase family protein [Spirochaetota bacterium]
MTSEKVLIIGGGVGPMAGVALHARIIENTLSGGSDQGHLDLRHFSRSADVTDRTEFLLGREAISPADGMARTMGMATAGLGGHDGVIGVPCNTFHAPAIFRPFTDQVAGIARTAGVSLQVVDMLGETMALLKQLVPRAGLIGIMSTTGTRLSGVYDELLAGAGLLSLHVDEVDQAELHAAIYDPAWGIKATGQPGIRATTTLRALATKLADRGAQAIILGCTELPLALTESSICGIPLVDPVLALARAMIREAAPAKLAPLPRLLQA